MAWTPRVPSGFRERPAVSFTPCSVGCPLAVLWAAPDWQLSGTCGLYHCHLCSLSLGPLLQKIKASLQGTANPRSRFGREPQRKHFQVWKIRKYVCTIYFSSPFISQFGAACSQMCWNFSSCIMLSNCRWIFILISSCHPAFWQWAIGWSLVVSFPRVLSKDQNSLLFYKGPVWLPWWDKWWPNTRTLERAVTIQLYTGPPIVPTAETWIGGSVIVSHVQVQILCECASFWDMDASQGHYLPRLPKALT